MDCIMHHVGNISDESNGQVRMRMIVDMSKTTTVLTPQRMRMNDSIFDGSPDV